MNWTKILLIALVFPFSFAATGQTTNDCPTISSFEQFALFQIYTATEGKNWDRPWDFTKSICEWEGVTITNGKITGIDLPDNNLIGSLPSSICHLSALKTLNLYQNKLVGGIPDCIGDLTELTTLNLSDNSLTGIIPTNIYKLPILRTLSLNRNLLEGEIPDCIGEASSLTTLNLSENYLNGDLPEGLGNLQNLLLLILNNNEISGVIPNSLGNLNALLILNLNSNQLNGSIPESLAGLSSVVELDLGTNELTGSVPAALAQLSVIRRLLLSDNLLEGELPEELSLLSSLGTFIATNNRLSGCIPESYKVFCETNTDFIGNADLLPNQGDFAAFCSGTDSCRVEGSDEEEEEECLQFEIEGTGLDCYMKDIIVVNIIQGSPLFTVQVTRDGNYLGQFQIASGFRIPRMKPATYDITIIDANNCQATEQVTISSDCQLVGDVIASSRSQSNAPIVNLEDFAPSTNQVDVFANYPNPFTRGTTLPFSLSTTQDLTISIVNATGQQVYQVNQTFEAGDHQVQLEENIFTQTGLYIYQVQYGDKLISGKLIKL